MFKNMKSAFIWYHLYKFRKTFTIIVFLLFLILFSQWIYSDIVQYLKLRDKLAYLDIILPLKWFIIFLCLTISTTLFLNLFKGKEEENITKNEEKDIKKTKITKKEEELSKREKSFLYKKNLKSRAESIINN